MNKNNKNPTIRSIMMPKDTNYMGSIFGGHILSLIDLAAAQKAREIKTLKFVTKIVKEVNFIAPVYVGDQVSFYTEVLKIGNSSVSVKVEVEAIRRSNTSLCEQVTSAEVILVAVDENNKAVKIG